MISVLVKDYITSKFTHSILLNYLCIDIVRKSIFVSYRITGTSSLYKEFVLVFLEGIIGISLKKLFQ